MTNALVFLMTTHTFTRFIFHHPLTIIYPKLKKEHLISAFYDEHLLNILTFINDYLIIFIRCENEKVTFS